MLHPIKLSKGVSVNMIVRDVGKHAKAALFCVREIDRYLKFLCVKKLHLSRKLERRAVEDTFEFLCVCILFRGNIFVHGF